MCGKGETICLILFPPPVCIFPLRFLQSTREVQVVFNRAWDPPFPAALITRRFNCSHFILEVAIQQPIILL